MPIVVLTQAAGSPGTSTTALGLTLAWPSQAILVEADPAGSTIVSGWYRSSITSTERNLINVVTGGYRSDEDMAEKLLGQCTIMDGVQDQTRLFMIGLVDPAQAPALQDWWELIGQGFRALSDQGWTVIVDAGRLTQASYPMPLLAEADQVLLVCRGTLASMLRSHPMAGQLQQTLAGYGRADRLGLTVIDSGHGALGYSAGDGGKAFRTTLSLAIPEDREGAAVLSDGIPQTRRRRLAGKSKRSEDALTPAADFGDTTIPGDTTLMSSYRRAAATLLEHLKDSGLADQPTGLIR